MPGAHSEYSASGWKAAAGCPGKTVLEAGLSDVPSVHAAWGTVAHFLAEQALSTGAESVSGWIGTVREQDGHSILIDDEMAQCVMTYVSAVREMGAQGQTLLVEQQVDYSEALGLPPGKAWGTADAIVVDGDEWQVHDLKTGKGVAVTAENNDQLMLYALGAITQFSPVYGTPPFMRLVIHQPRILSAPDEWVISTTELLEWAQTTGRSTVATRQNAKAHHGTVDQAEWERTYLRPNEDSCRWCKAKATCPALRQAVVATVQPGAEPATPDEFTEALSEVKMPDAQDDAGWLSAALSMAPAIEAWLSAVAAEARRRIEAGQPVPGWKLVLGRRGARAWSNAAEAEKILRERVRLSVDEAYEKTVISPTAVDALRKVKKVGDKHFAMLSALVTQAPAKPTLAPDSDPRPAVDFTPVVEDFEATSPEAASANIETITADGGQSAAPATQPPEAESFI